MANIKVLRFTVYGKPTQRFYNFDTHRFTKGLYRVVYAINYGWHRKYYSYKGYVYTKTYNKALEYARVLTNTTPHMFKRYRRYSIDELIDAGDVVKTGLSIQPEPYTNQPLDQINFRDESV